MPGSAGTCSQLSAVPTRSDRDGVEATSGSVAPGWLADLLMLTKARANVAVVATAVIGYGLHADIGSNWLLLLCLIVGTALMAGGASMANQAMEQEFDRLMARTRNRPIAGGRLDRSAGFFLSALFGMSGWLCLAAGVNLNASIHGFLAFVVYVGIYTPMKRLSPACAVAGAVSGALPLWIGCAAAEAGFGLWAWVTFAVLYLWQMPHFMAIAWWRREDYLGAGYRVLPGNDAAGFKTAVLALTSTLGVVALSLIPMFAGNVRGGYGAGAMVLGTLFTVPAMRFCANRSGRNARALFLASLIYLPAIFVLMLTCQLR